jgi:hypothetical protein
MPAVAYELARPTPPALGTVVGSALGPGRIVKRSGTLGLWRLDVRP